ncbi:MAG: acyl-CoA dehydrogenase [Candidatus Dadabacteria bacterium]|nr:MAG: acyl-CoA dehydrogenase [Candidatus Dadabacteria bacterium]
MADLEQFRQEVRAWIEANAPAGLRGTRKGRFDGYWGGRLHPEPDPDVKRWFDACLERGWTAPTWPAEYGGGGLSRAEAEIIDEEMERVKVPPPLVGFGLVMIGPTLLDFGTDEQKAEHLPKIVRGEVRWCQGYSEPGAGSDLAGLQTRAEIQGDKVIVNGQKVWTSYADKSDWIFALVRTDPDAKKQEGITFLLIDMLQDGVTTRTIDLISGWSPFCEVFFDNAVAETKNIVGGINKGWTVAKALLGYERSMIGKAIEGQLAGTEQELAASARAHLGRDDGPLPDASLRQQLALYSIDEQCYAQTARRIAETAQATGAPGPESSIMKVAGSELKQRRWELATRIAGLHGIGWDGEPFSEDELNTTRQWLRSRANTIEGGSTEIQLNIIAKRVLGLPS